MTNISTVSIGFYRDDNDFQILCTMNNGDDLVQRDVFNAMVAMNLGQFKASLGELYDIVCLERQDAPDYVTIDTGDV